MLKGLNLSKSENSKSVKLSKPQKSAKSRKKLLKSGNSHNFNAKKAGLSFLTFGARETFNCLWLMFIKVLILQHFDLKYYIGIEIDASDYAIGTI